MSGSFLSHAPRYLQIAEALRVRIVSMDPGARLPSEPQLAKEFGVSRFTVTRAVEVLMEEGLITRRQGSGTFVAEAPLRRAPGYLLSFTEAVAASGHKSSHRLLAYGPTQWVRGMPYKRDEELVMLDRLRLVDDVAVARHRSVLSKALVQRIGLTEAHLSDPQFSLYNHLEGKGLSAHSATERLIACTAEPDDRTLLGLARGGVVIAVNRNSFAADGTVLDSVSAIYDARRYSYEAQLVRQHRSGNTLNIQENDHDPQTFIGDGHAGPRLGPWTGDGLSG